MKISYGNGSVETDSGIKAFKIRYTGKIEITPAENMNISSNQKTIVGFILSGEPTTQLFSYDGNLKITRCEVVSNEELVYPVISYQGAKLPENINSDPEYISEKPEDMDASYGKPKQKTTIKENNTTGIGKKYGI